MLLTSLAFAVAVVRLAQRQGARAGAAGGRGPRTRRHPVYRQDRHAHRGQARRRRARAARWRRRLPRDRARRARRRRPLAQRDDERDRGALSRRRGLVGDRRRPLLVGEEVERDGLRRPRARGSSVLPTSCSRRSMAIAPRPTASSCCPTGCASSPTRATACCWWRTRSRPRRRAPARRPRARRPRRARRPSASRRGRHASLLPGTGRHREGDLRRRPPHGRCDRRAARARGRRRRLSTPASCPTTSTSSPDVLESHSVFGRVTPQQKRAMVQALQVATGTPSR